MARPVELKHGQVLSEPGEEITYVDFPRAGAISLMVMMRDGSAVETRMIGREGVTGVNSHATRHVATSRAMVQLPRHASINVAACGEAAERAPAPSHAMYPSV